MSLSPNRPGFFLFFFSFFLSEIERLAAGLSNIKVRKVNRLQRQVQRGLLRVIKGLLREAAGREDWDFHPSEVIGAICQREVGLTLNRFKVQFKMPIRKIPQ